ncbi:bone morphogenetic protein receptor type-2-like [Mastacembelus armatus]|uniref:receptor protein serine/threonine kinase n=1 Tax=Mastacembelus armatus TaxID=205130 RepID=A0A3Q3MLA4_9TELE|nr:bone morphogenetic protein receptor type-2-like [Mastacembelus armatus]XP_026151912.1 bone morphogenetic protein receptor type-2-like [Mastacembelus armatus]
MAAVRGVMCLCVLLLLLPAVTGLQSEDRECAFTDHLQGAELHNGPTNELRGVVRENGTIRCSRGSRCYGLWEKKPDGEMHLVKQGCWTHIGGQQECHGDRCLVSATPSQIQNGSYRFCCCSQDLCNTNFTEAPPTFDTPALRLMKPSRSDNRQTDHQPLKWEETALIALVTVAIAAVLIMALFLGYRMMKAKHKLSLSALDVMEAANTESAINLENLKLLELIGRGRYGVVFRGCLNERCVAVKVFSSANRQNYANELSIYCLLQQHVNIAHFLAADERTTPDGRPEFLILMEYYPQGSLSQYLAVHTVDWPTCCRMTHGVTRGLAFLHTELYRGDQYKPAVAHRDMTSRNILVRADLSCVLADFGLSMKLTGDRTCRPGEDDAMAISEVGTVRYMAPEVLGGALNLRDCESALKQVDVYALGLLYWESFRRCSDLFPGEAVPEYQLAFQAELGNHPSFEDLQVLVAREKYRPRFPEAWKENSLTLRMLKETMEDCWDQDAEARLTAQCAEERLSELTLLSTHTAIHNHRNLSHGCWAPQVGSTSSYIEDLQVDVVKNLQGDEHPAPVKTTTSGAEGAEKNRNSINYERQRAQTQTRLSSPDSSVSATTAMMPATIFYSISESEHTGGAVPCVPVCLQLTEEDLEATKLDPKEVDKNLRESSDENLMEHSQKQFSSELQTTNLLYHQILQTTEANGLVLTPPEELGCVDGLDTPPSSSIHSLPKQQNLPQRPTSLHLLPKTKETTSASSGLQLAKLKSNHRQVETGVAKMNTVAVATAAEPHMVTTVTNHTSTRVIVANGNRVHPIMVVSSSYNAGVPTLVTNSMIGGGRTNPAGPQLDEEDQVEGRMTAGEDDQLNLLNFSPDEHEPLLRREQPPAESEPLPHLHHQSRAGNILSGRGSNSNNNNNRIALGSEVKIQGLEVKSERMMGSQVSPGTGISNPKHESHLLSQTISGSPAAVPLSHMENLLLYGQAEQATATGPCLQDVVAELVLASGQIQNPEFHLIHSAATVQVPDARDPDCGSTEAPKVVVPETSGTPPLKALDKTPETLDTSSKAVVLDVQKPSTADAPTLGATASCSEDSRLEFPTSENPAPETPVLGSQTSVPAAAQTGPTADLLQSQMGQTKARRPERPCSLDLSSSCIYSDDVGLADNGALSASGEKIKRRVKTPYTLKKWRPASWVVSTDTALDLDFEFNPSGSSSRQTYFSSGLHKGGSSGVPKINQSKSSMAVFLVDGGTTATTTSEPDGMTCF